MSRRSKRITPTPTAPSNGLSAYEVARFERIAENKEVMKQLGLDRSRNALLTSSHATRKRKPTSRGVRTLKKKNKKPKLPARRSLRCQGLNSTGEKLPDDFKVLPQNSSYTSSRVDERNEEEKRLKGDVQVLDGAGKYFLNQLLGQSSSARRGGKKATTSKQCRGVENAAKAFSQLSVDEDHGVRKVTPERIYSLAIMPSEDGVVVAAGDKKGSVGIWNVGSTQLDDGVFSFRPHYGCISHLSFSNVHSNKLLTSSYDGSMKIFVRKKKKKNMIPDIIIFFEDTNCFKYRLFSVKYCRTPTTASFVSSSTSTTSRCMSLIRRQACRRRSWQTTTATFTCWI
jgi:WD40 repeat protein